MRLLTWAKSYWNSSLFRTAIVTGIGLWTFIQLPLLIAFYSVRTEQERGELARQRQAIESLLVSSLEQGSRYGDVVNARGKAIELGMPLGLKDIGICKGGGDILAKFGDYRCKGSQEFGAHALQLSSENVEVRFYWQEYLPTFFRTIGTAIIISVSVSLFIVVLLGLTMYIAISRKVKNLADRLSNISGETETLALGEVEPEFAKLRISLLLLRERISKYHTQNRDLATKAAKADLAAQVAHDVRSPLSALNMVLGTLDGFAADKVDLIRGATKRINDIANDLLRENKKTPDIQSKNEKCLIFEILKSISDEKRMQFSFSSDIEIVDDLLSISNVLVSINSALLSRAISNIVNNAVEALNGKGRVLVSAVYENGSVRITISDNGSGISDEFISRIGERGFSTGKGRDLSSDVTGSGLGVFQARETFLNSNGTFEIVSKLDVGTSVLMTLPGTVLP